MSRIDALTGKRPNFGNSRSHSNIATRRRQNVNLQTVTLNGRKIRIATSTLRTLKRLAAIAHGEIPTRAQKKAARNAKRAATAKKA